MAYINGTVSSWADLIVAVRSACTANGYTLSGEVLHKNNAFVRLYLHTTGNEVRIEGGTGLGAGNTLLVPSPTYSWVGVNGALSVPVFPIQYHIHIHENPDEVYVMLNYNGTYWQWLAFGKSSLASALAVGGGNGGWFGATFQSNHPRGAGITLNANGYGGGFAGSPTGNRTGAGLFNGGAGWTNNNVSSNCLIHHGYPRAVSTDGWSDIEYVDRLGYALAIDYQYPLLNTQPNTWNGQSVLIPIVVTAVRPESKRSVVAQLGHARYCRNDNYGHLEVVEFGSDKWRIYPFYFKNSSARNGGSNVDHSGTFAHAIRYDGP